MRIPEQQRQHRSGQQFQEDSTHFLQPGAFTVLSSDNVPPPDPPMAPQPYSRLATPNTRRHKNHSFAIIAEPGSSRSGSPSPSPSGRVSPFRGRGFNPAGSRHASPVPSPPPTPSGIQSASSSRSKIPKLTRRGSASVFGERIDDYLSSPNRRKLHSQLSQSLTNISTRKPPPSPRRRQQQQHQRQSGHSRSFQCLSPIIGSSPEPSQSQSSPATTTTATRRNKPSSRPGSRYNSPSRNRLPPPSSQDGRNSRQSSRDPSPNKIPTSPSRIPVKNNYKNVQSKINSLNRNNKPKVPPKPQVLSETSDSSDINRGNNTYRTRTESLKKLKTNHKSNNPTSRNSKNDVTKPKQDNKNGNRSNENHDQNGNKIEKKSGDGNLNSDTITDKTNNNSNTNRTQNNNNNNSNSNKNRSQGNNNSNNNNKDTKSNDNDKVAVSSNTDSEDNKKSYDTPVKLSDLLQPSTTTVVSSTTTTVTQPLKIEAKMEQNLLEPQREPTKSSTDSTVKTVSTTTPTTTTTITTTTTTIRRSEPTTRIESKTIAPMVDGRVLSATSVSNAMNKMNDTVLDTQTLMKDHGISKLSPSVNIGDIKSNEMTTRNNSGLDVKSTANNVEMNESANNKPNENNHRYHNNNNNNNSNHITSTGIIPARLLDEHVQNNMAKLIGPDNNLISNTKGKNINEMLRESRTVVTDDVKPIRITVKEKPMDVDVQSGNIRFDAANGISERPSLPPTQPVNPNEQPQETQDAVERNRCARFFTNFRNKFRNNKPKETINITKDEQGEKAGCFNCRKKIRPDVTINIENDEPKKRFWDRFKCCKSKIGDKSENHKRKDSWTDRRDSIFSGPIEKKTWWRRIFCLDKCRKQKKPLEDPASRRASMMSKKKSLTSSVPVEDNTPKLDLSLVEHNSTMRGAIPVLPVSLAWFCLVMNCIIPGTGTIFSGIFCLCLGIPRFSQKDGPRSRLGAFIIDTIIGVGQCFTVLFCLVGWGWSIWWGVIMLKIAKKHRKIKALEAEAEKQEAGARQSSQQRDIEKGTGTTRIQ